MRTTPFPTIIRKACSAPPSSPRSLWTARFFIVIGAANGTFDGDRCFNDRSWTVRIHQPEGWGVLQSVSNGTDELSFTKVEQDTDAMPMEVEGGAADGVVYEVKVSGNVYEAMQLVATFENTG